MIKNLLLASALFLPHASFAAKPAKTVPPAAWVTAKDDARRWTDKLLENAGKRGQDVAGLRAELDRAWAIAANAEKTERLLNDKRLVARPKEAAKSQKMLELNLLYVYGNILPRIIDESTENIAPGRAFAGADVKAAIADDAYRAQWAGLSKSMTAPANLNPEMPRPEAASN